jgi:hypothetical protein
MLRYGSERGAVLPHPQQACSAKPDSTKMLFAFRTPTQHEAPGSTPRVSHFRASVDRELP